MMDLRWGIREQSRNDHTIIEFCLREIDKCKTKSIGPNFVVSSHFVVFPLFFLFQYVHCIYKAGKETFRPSVQIGKIQIFAV